MLGSAGRDDASLQVKSDKTGSHVAAVKSLTRGSAVVAALLLALSLPTSASAQHGGSDEGGTGGGPVKAPASVVGETQQALDKQALAEAWMSEYAPTSSASPNYARAVSEDASSFEDLATQYEATYGQSVPASPLSTGASSAGTGGAVSYATAPSPNTSTNTTLAIGWVQQQTGYYCGPATGYMMLKYGGHTASAVNGASLTQARLASSTYMKTDANGETSTWTSNMSNGLNLWRSGSTSGYYVRNLVESSSELKTSFVYSTYWANEPLAVSTGETAGGTHYNKHPDRTIGHWVVGSGFSNSGNTIKMTDPAAGLSGGYASSAKTFTYSTSSMYSLFVAGRYNVW